MSIEARTAGGGGSGIGEGEGGGPVRVGDVSNGGSEAKLDRKPGYGALDKPVALQPTVYAGGVKAQQRRSAAHGGQGVHRRAGSVHAVPAQQQAAAVEQAAATVANPIGASSRAKRQHVDQHVVQQ